LADRSNTLDEWLLRLTVASSRRGDGKKLYQAAIIELDSAKLPGRIAEARRAILDRAKEILTTSPDEHYFLNDALRSLLLLEVVAEREKRTRAAASRQKHL
jgi:hypothetical protein